MAAVCSMPALAAGTAPAALRQVGGSGRAAALAPARRVALQPRRQRRSSHVVATLVAPGGAGEPARFPSKPYIEVELPPLAQDFVPALAELPPEAFGAARKAKALFFPPAAGTAQHGATVPAVVFCHGFSQPPQNYMSTLQKFTEQGWMVIAPTTGLLNIVFSKIETTSWRSKPPAKLQTALILDALRSAQYLHMEQGDYKVGPVLMCGHSMGGAGAIVAASKLKDMVTGVGVMAPAVKQTLETAVNPRLAGLPGNAAVEAAAVQFFGSDYPAAAPLHILGGEKDFIVPKKEVNALYNAAVAGDETGDMFLYWLDGDHIGFEDKVNLEFNTGLPQALLFLVIDILLYRLEVTKWFTGDYSEQREAAQATLVTAFQKALAGEGRDAVADNGIVTVAPRPSQAAVAAMRDPPVVAPPQDAPWVVPTLLLLGYAGVHAASLSEGLSLLGSSAGELRQFDYLGLGIATLLAAGLVYENLILAAGRFITDGGRKNLELLDALNDPRFLFHSAAPLLCLTGISLAERLGVGWASNPWFVGATATACGVELVLSTIRNTLLLQTKPTWSAGIFHYTFDDKGLDFTRIIPVALTTLLLTLLGGAATLQDASQWPFLAGPAACLALSAGVIPRSVAPMILTGNAGEVLLIASLMLTEARLLGQDFL